MKSFLLLRSKKTVAILLAALLTALSGPGLAVSAAEIQASSVRESSSSTRYRETSTDDEEEDEDDEERAAQAQEAADRLAEQKRQQEAEMKELNEKISALQNQEKEIQNNIAQTQTAKAQQLANKRALSGQISVTQDQIKTLEDKITLLENQIAQKKEEIAALEASIAANYDTYKQRMRAMYMSGNATSLGVLLGAEEFSDLLIQGELVKRVAQHDNALLDNLNADKAQLQEVKLSLDANMADLDDTKLQLEEKKQSLGTQLNVTETKIQEYAADEKAFMAQKDELMKARQELQNELTQIFANMGSIGDYVGGEFAWPLPGYSQISSGFGMRFGGSDYHTGIDITGGSVYGKSITAANSGEVSYIGYAPNAYGNYLIIDHGGGKSTLYAHCSSVDVSVGQRVVKGAHIAQVGSTGWSTGPHLHFEIREGTAAQNPMNYFTRVS